MSLKTYEIIVTHTGKRKKEEYQESLNFLFWKNVSLIKAFPFLLDTFNQIKYKREKKDKWFNILILWFKGYGDCEDISCAVAAILYVMGYEDARPVIIEISEIDFHVVVYFNDQFYDPNKSLGM